MIILLDINIINNKETKITLCDIDNKSLNTPIYELDNNLKSKILKN